MSLFKNLLFSLKLTRRPVRLKYTLNLNHEKMLQTHLTSHMVLIPVYITMALSSIASNANF